MTAPMLVSPGLWVAWGPSDGHGDADRLLGGLVSARLGAARPIGRLCPQCGSTAHGRPTIEDGPVGPVGPVGLSLSRAPGLAVAALSTDGSVGVDVERAGAAGFEGFEDVGVHADEAAADPTLTWVRKEALLKAAGCGLAVDPQRVRLDPSGQLATWDFRLPDPARCRLTDLDLPAGYVGAVAVIRP